MKNPQKILLIEHEVRAARVLRDAMRTAFNDANVVFDGATALRDIQTSLSDFLIVDADSLNDIAPLTLIREIRRTSEIPILLFGSKYSLTSQIRMLESGADDFISGHPDTEELAARIHAIWRRYLIIPPVINKKTSFECVDYPYLHINLTNYSVQYDGKTLEMPPKELELLYFLASSPNQVFTREQLLDHIWGYDYVGDARTVDVHIKRIRAKIKDHETWSLDTVWGVGYRFSFRSSLSDADGPSSPSVQTDSV
ncbi:MAG: winged helix-turn-helix domain-containing protein [Marvinbryantia sp.]|jgi:two-component system response regulator ResD